MEEDDSTRLDLGKSADSKGNASEKKCVPKILKESEFTYFGRKYKKPAARFALSYNIDFDQSLDALKSHDVSITYTFDKAKDNYGDALSEPVLEYAPGAYKECNEEYGFIKKFILDELCKDDKYYPLKNADGETQYKINEWNPPNTVVLENVPKEYQAAVLERIITAFEHLESSLRKKPYGERPKEEKEIFACTVLEKQWQNLVGKPAEKTGSSWMKS